VAIDYATLIAAKTTEGSIRNWVNREDIAATNILIEAQALIYEKFRAREMMTDAAFVFDEGFNVEALPADFLDPIQYVPYTWGEALPYYHEQHFQIQRDSSGTLVSGTPSGWTIIGVGAYVDVAVTEDFGGRLMYYALPANLGSGNSTNFLTVRYPTLLRVACMCKAFEHMKDTARAGEYLKMTLLAIQQAMASNDLFRRSQHLPA
jgi:hypothetical protein